MQTICISYHVLHNITQIKVFRILQITDLIKGNAVKLKFTFFEKVVTFFGIVNY